MARREDEDEKLFVGSSTHRDLKLVVTLHDVVEIVRAGDAASSNAEITLLTPQGTLARIAPRQIATGHAIKFRGDYGPRVAAYRDRAITRIHSVLAESRWPEFCEEAARAGIGSVLSFPLIARGAGVGVLSLYSDTDSILDRRAELIGATFAPMLSAIITAAPPIWR